MSEFIITTTQDCIRQLQYKVEADSLEEAMKNYEDGEIIGEDYEPSGEEWVYDEDCYKINY